MLNMRQLGCVFLLLQSVSLYSCAANAQDKGAAFAQQATNAQEKGDSAQAIALYEKAVDHGVVNGDLFYNLGIAYFRTKDIGHAMASFLAAKRFEPRNPDIKANLKFVHTKIQDNLEYSDPPSTLHTFVFWLDEMTTKEAFKGLAALSLLSGLLIVIGVLLSHPGVRKLGLFSLILPVLAALNLYLVSQNVRNNLIWGAVTAQEAGVHSDLNTKSKVLFNLKAGAPVKMVSKVAGWYHIKLSDGKTGWLAESDAKVYVPF